jgi:acid phosphatase (class A)
MPVNRIDTRLLLILLSFLTTACAASDEEPGEDSIEIDAASWFSPFTSGYLRRSSVPSSVSLLGAPPTAGTPAMQADQAANSTALTQRFSQRWQQAAKDAELAFPAATNDFACALNSPISQRQTPTLARLLLRAALDAGGATQEAKERYNRPRPFEVNRQPICTPESARSLRSDGSYPSGHSAVGWAWGVLLSQLAPERKDQILERAHEFGQSRVICNVHWQSDVEAGRAVAEAVVQQLHTNLEFKRDFATAGREIERARSRGLRPMHKCE